jgi:L-lactate dehydrogenase complex protein LldE
VPRVTLFPTCLATLLFPGAAEAGRRVLEVAGVEVGDASDVCCGQPAWNSGHVDEARRVATGALDAVAGNDPVVVCSGSCTTMIKHYWPDLFAGTEHHDRALEVADNARELCSFLVDDVGVEALGPLRARKPAAVGYHDSCHMLRGLGIRDAPRKLLAHIDGIEVHDLPAAERCCGFGGTFSLRYPELSSAMADEKVDDLQAQHVDEVVASDLGCLMQIRGRAEARSVPLGGRYIAEVVADALPRECR